MADKKKGRPRIIPPSEIEEWIEKYGDNTYLPRGILCTQTLIENEIIEEEHEFACYLLFKSIESRIHSCRYSQGIYEGVFCEWDVPLNGVMDIIRHKPEMWQGWIEQTRIFLENDQQQKYRPTIDRIETDPNIGYRLDNIQLLSFRENTQRAVNKPVYAFEMGKNQSNVIPTFRRYDSITDAKKDLGLPKLENDTGVFTNTQDGKTFILQSSATTVGDQSVELDSNESEQKVYTGYIPIGQIEIDGQLYTINQPFTFEQMQIKLKNEA
ncbi:hypothetical protein IFU39_19150 [Paenibacillus sp. CFBP 13594]|uniref:hypothetical protein n=1 Tax=Paenibacillus sp. CFBP 13594 TaxID=2774037 RepID=UPI0017812194|nr:hypothetical protein [Paenibacillus sp. CFBP 13594]MBD8839935.1 hypothetical protein [Paenibacillus sp. CFBP 13594]